MRKLTLLLFLFIGVVISDASAKDIRILIVTGGHDFDRESFFGMFDSMKGISYQELKQPQANLQLGQIDPKSYDAVVFYDMPKTISDKEKESYYKLLQLGKGLLFLHHSLCSYQDWQEYKTIVGGKYHEEKNSPQSSTYQHDVTFPVILADKKHAVTKGMKDFSLLDEVYGNTEVLPTVKVLLKTNNPLSSQIIGWSHQMEKSRIVYIQPGHDKNAYNNADYQRLIRQAIGYVSKS
jgi:type 1 glutamine amidotransferase